MDGRSILKEMRLLGEGSEPLIDEFSETISMYVCLSIYPNLTQLELMRLTILYHKRKFTSTVRDLYQNNYNRAKHSQSKMFEVSQIENMKIKR